MGYVLSFLSSIRNLLTAFSNYSKEKMHINVVVIGHVDSGKSTTTGTASIQNNILPHAHTSQDI